MTYFFYVFFIGRNNFIIERLLHVQMTQRSLKNYKKKKNCMQNSNDYINDEIELLFVKS